jgi:hypothetical protein
MRYSTRRFAGVLADGFDSVREHVYELVSFEELFDLAPVTIEKNVIFISAEIAKS